MLTDPRANLGSVTKSRAHPPKSLVLSLISKIGFKNNHLSFLTAVGAWGFS